MLREPPGEPLAKFLSWLPAVRPDSGPICRAGYIKRTRGSATPARSLPGRNFSPAVFTTPGSVLTHAPVWYHRQREHASREWFSRGCRSLAMEEATGMRCSVRAPSPCPTHETDHNPGRRRREGPRGPAPGYSGTGHGTSASERARGACEGGRRTHAQPTMLVGTDLMIGDMDGPRPVTALAPRRRCPHAGSSLSDRAATVGHRGGRLCGRAPTTTPCPRRGSRPEAGLLS